MTTAKAKPKKQIASKTKPAKAKTKSKVKARAKISTKAKMKKTVDKQSLTRLIEDIIEDGANTAEDINRAVLDLPVNVLVNLGLKEPANQVKHLQDASIGAIYKLIHEINHEVADLASKLLKKRKSAKK